MTEKKLAELFKEYVGEEYFSESHQKSYFSYFNKIIRYSVGSLPPYVSFSKGEHISYLWDSFMSVCDGFAKKELSSYVREEDNDFYLDTFSKKEKVLGKIVGANMARKIDINQASIHDLDKFPGLGKTSAYRIKNAILKYGLVSHVYEFEKIDGISKENLEALETYFTVNYGDHLENRPYSSDIKFSFRDLLDHEVQKFSLGCFEGQYPKNKKTIARDLLRSISQNVEMTPYWNKKRSLDIQDVRDHKKGHELFHEGRQKLSSASVVRNYSYFELLTHLCKTSKESIDVQMFLFPYDDSNSIGGRIINELEGAIKRGVKVRIIIDSEDDHNPSYKRNSDTVQKLLEIGAEVREDKHGIKSHSKVVICDRESFLIGTHNWSTNSIYRTDETSLLLVGEGVAEAARAHFNILWEIFVDNSKERNIPVDYLRSVSDAEKRILKEHEIFGTDEISKLLRTSGQKEKLSKASGIEVERLEFIYDLGHLMQDLGVPEYIAFASVRIGVDTPTKFRRKDESDLKSEIVAATKAPIFKKLFSFRSVDRKHMEI